MNIYQRVNAVMQKVTYIKKDTKVQGYSAVTHDNVFAMVRAELVRVGIVIYPEQLGCDMPIMRDGKDIKMHLYTADYLIHFVNIDKPDDRISVKINSHANDNGDKAPGKALSYATKYAILKVFSMETGENDESRSEALATITPSQIKGVNSLLVGEDAIKDRMFASLKIESVEEILKADYNNTIVRIKKAKNENN